MKKLLLAVFVGTFCLSTTHIYAQNKQETPQEQIMRLEIENKVRKELMDSLSRRVAVLQAQLAAEKVKNQQQSQKQTNSHNNKAGTKAKPRPPYCVTDDIYYVIRQLPQGKEWAEQMYATDKSFKIIEAHYRYRFLHPNELHISFLVQNHQGKNIIYY